MRALSRTAESNPIKTQRLSVVVLSALLIVAFLTGCSTSDPAPQPSSYSYKPTPSEDLDATSLPDAPEDEETPATRTVESDPKQKESMTCLNLSTEQINAIKFQFGQPKNTAMVEVGPGLNLEQIWWVVVLDSPAYENIPARLRKFLSTAPSNRAFDGQWIELGTKSPWENIEWSQTKLVTAQSALEVAEECVIQ